MKKIMFNDRFGLTEAVLAGRKTQTRRMIKSKRMIARHWNPAFNADQCYYTDERGKCQLIDADTDKIIVPMYKVGEVVAVAQSYESIFHSKHSPNDFLLDSSNMNPKYCGVAFNNKMFVRADLMPHHIRITDVRVERLQDISDEDCLAEGIGYVNGYSDSYYFGHGVKTGKGWIRLGNSYRDAYAALIDKISGKGTWESNPYVFVYDFELVD